MPNWSYNNLTITGSDEDVKKFIECAVKENVNNQPSFKFSNVFPTPEKIKNTISPSSSAVGRKWINEDRSTIRNDKINDLLDQEENDSGLIPCENNTPEKCKLLKEEYGADNWYDWNIMTYGTKWDVEVLQDDCIIDNGSFECYFDTAWSPPSTFLLKLQQKFKNLDIRLTYELEGSDECGVFRTNRYNGEVSIDHEEDQVSFVAEDGRNIYFSDSDGEWHYEDDDEVCYDILTVNPLK